MKKKTESYYIAYFDILGYKAFFENTENDINEFLDFNINLVSDITKRAENNTNMFNYPFVLKMFSDNFAILVKNSDDIGEYHIVRVLSYLLASLQLRFLEKYRIVVRGVITKGHIYVDDQLIFGEGLIRAVSQEEREKFPRIIIDKEKINREVCEKLCKRHLSKDEDDEYYIDFFKAIENNVQSDKVEGYIESLRENIMTLVRKYGKYNRNLKDINKIQIAEKTISKYAWLLSKFNMYCDGNYRHLMIPYTLTLYSKLMKAEINLLE